MAHISVSSCMNVINTKFVTQTGELNAALGLQNFHCCSSKGCSLGAHVHRFLVSIYVWLHGLHITHSFSLPINLHLILEYQGIRSPYFGNCALHLLINMSFLPQYLKEMNFGAHYLFLSYGVSRKTCVKIATTFMGLLSSRLPFHTNIVRLLMPLLVSILCQTPMAPFYY